MPFLDVVGRYPEESGTEETYRRTVSKARGATRGRPRGRLWTRLLLVLGVDRFARRRWRLQTAGIAALGLILLLMFALPLRTLHIVVDGRAITTHSRSIAGKAVVRNAGVALRTGDRVESHGDTLVVGRAIDARVTVDDQVFVMRSQARTIAELLEQAGVALGDDDGVLRGGTFVSPADPINGPPGSAQATVSIEVRRAVPFTVVEGGQQTLVRSGRTTVGSALRDVGVHLGPGDAVQPPLDTTLTASLQVHVQRASRLLVTLPEGNAFVYSIAPTVGEAIAQSGITLPADYRLEPPAETAVNAGLAVHVVGVSEQHEVETERIQSYVVYQPDPALPAGAQRVVQGQDGVQHRQFDVVSEDGVQVSRDLASEWYDPAPADTIVYYSTAPAPVAAAATHAASGDWRDLVCSYDWDCNWALAVIQCESSGNADAYNPAGYVGLFQVWEGYASNLTDPATNVAAAYSLYVSGGTGNWPHCP